MWFLILTVFLGDNFIITLRDSNLVQDHYHVVYMHKYNSTNNNGCLNIVKINMNIFAYLWGKPMTHILLKSKSTNMGKWQYQHNDSKQIFVWDLTKNIKQQFTS